MSKEVETVVAVVPVEEVEKGLTIDIETIQQETEQYVIKNQDDYQNAAELGGRIKSNLSRVKKFFEPMKKSAHNAHKEICARETEMLKPLVDAENSIKMAMRKFNDELEKKRRAYEEEQKKRAQEESDRKLAKAAAAEKNGDSEEAVAKLLDAQMISEFGNMTVVTAASKPSNVTTTTDYEITAVDENAVPTILMGIIIRPIDMAAVKRLIKSSKGTIKIPGITYKEVKKISLRRA